MIFSDIASAQIVRFFRFLRLFGTSVFSLMEVNVENSTIRAVVAWPEDCTNGLPPLEETQEVMWFFDDEPCLDDALIVGEYLFSRGAIKSDKLYLGECDIEKFNNWAMTRVYKAIDKLKRVKVSMIEDGEVVDFFMFHE